MKFFFLQLNVNHDLHDASLTLDFSFFFIAKEVFYNKSTPMRVQSKAFVFQGVFKALKALLMAGACQLSKQRRCENIRMIIH